MPRLAASLLPPLALEPGAPLYRQLTDWFRQAILDGRLRAGQRIPSTRGLAKELGISRIPVLSAYEQLLAEGYLESTVGAGTQVARSLPDETPKPVGPRGRDGVASPRRPVAERISATRLPDPTWLKNDGAFRVGLPALEHFPIKTWTRLITRHARSTHHDTMVYGDAMGQAPLREAIAAYLGTFRGVRCDASQIMVTTGSQQGLQCIAQALVDPGAKVWLEEPGYPGARQAFALVGAKLVPVRVDREGLDVAQGIRRARDARLAYITPSHQFPLGSTLSATRRMALLDWAERSGAWIVEDDYDSEYRFGGRPLAALQGSDTSGRVLYVGSFSKVMFPALRVGYVVVPRDLIPAFTLIREATDTFTATLQQAAMADFIREGHFARHLRRMRQVYRERHTALVQAVQEGLPGKLELMGADTGMHLSAFLPGDMDDVELTRRAASAGLSVRPLSICYLQPPVRSGLILGYGGASPAQIRHGVSLLKDLLP
ncbi:MAG TPA: PLP-dependent aminotransferase family protein [Gammaproteobacteria bacterium]|nr:PLP-dependent aminotransferase family protein [Gammaproteobacteria bacterium]